jgi:hypothetical protein
METSLITLINNEMEACVFTALHDKMYCENFLTFRKIGKNIKLQIKEIRKPDTVLSRVLKDENPSK